MFENFDFDKYVHHPPRLPKSIQQVFNDGFAAMEMLPLTESERTKAHCKLIDDKKAAEIAFWAPHNAVIQEKEQQFRSDIESHLGLARLPQTARDLMWYIATENTDEWYDRDQASDRPTYARESWFRRIADEMMQFAALVKIVRDDCASTIMAVCEIPQTTGDQS